jgi:pimeloyl-ACP methyl ester carboxylesterase
MAATVGGDPSPTPTERRSTDGYLDAMSTRTVVFVHGNPETAAIWEPLGEALAAQSIESIALSPPGFGAPVPDGFDPSMDGYATWLVDELERLTVAGHELDVVGHDWGAGHVAGALARRPDLFRTWTIDIAGVLDHDYVWHDLAQVWQTPEAGEHAVAQMATASTDDTTALFASLGLPRPMAAQVAAAVDEDMGRCILRLYRTGAQPAVGALGDRLATMELPPGLVVNAVLDPYVPTALTVATAERLGADVLTIDDRGHWWMVAEVDEIAGRLAAFWSQH